MITSSSEHQGVAAANTRRPREPAGPEPAGTEPAGTDQLQSTIQTSKVSQKVSLFGKTVCWST